MFKLRARSFTSDRHESSVMTIVRGTAHSARLHGEISGKWGRSIMSVHTPGTSLNMFSGVWVIGRRMVVVGWWYFIVHC